MSYSVKSTALALVIALSGAGVAHGAAPPEWLLGDWVLNNELTQAEQAKVKNKSGGTGGGFSSSVSIGGIPLPGSGSAQSGPGGTAKDPEVLRCREMTISSQGEGLLFDFKDAGKELMKRGNNKGRVTKWNKRKLTSRYETTSRKVDRQFEVADDGRILVTVKIKPNRSARITQKRVFERPAAAGAISTEDGSRS